VYQIERLFPVAIQESIPRSGLKRLIRRYTTDQDLMSVKWKGLNLMVKKGKVESKPTMKFKVYLIQ